MVDIIPVEQVEGSISTSRTFQEMLKIQHGDNAYRVLAATLDYSMPVIDSLAEGMGSYLAACAVKSKYDQQFFNPKYGKFKNFLTRNIYLDPLKKSEMERERFLVGKGVSLATEVAVKLGVRGIQKWANNRDTIKTFGEIYALLNSFANTDTDGANIRSAKVELKKIRSSFAVNDSQMSSIMKKYGKTLEIDELPDISALKSEGGDDLSMNIAYMLYAVCCQKFGDDERGLAQLMDYYSLLGFQGNMAREVLRENRESYATIASDQVKYLKISRSIITGVAVKIPEINIDRLNAQATAMAKYDPYSIRRSKTQSIIGGGGTTLAGIFSKRPDLVIQGASTALSQLQLENNDNAVEFLEKQFKANGIDNNAFGIIFKQSNEISKKSKTFDIL